jgi:HEAT repeat protein
MARGADRGALIAALCVMGTSGAAWAQDAKQDATQQPVVWRAPIEGLSGGKPWMRLEEPRPGGEARLVIEALRPKEEELGQMKLPEWAARSYYQHKLSAGPIGDGQFAVLFEALPTGEGAPADSPQIQVVWVFSQKSWAKKTWVVIAVAQHTEMDGGERLELVAPSKRGGVHVLERLRSRPTLHFCGAGDELDREQYRVAQGGFAPQVPVELLVGDAPELPAVVPARALEPPLLPQLFRWQAATSRPGKPPGAAAGGVIPRALGDGDLTTAWSEGADGMGRGEFVTAHVEDVLEVRAVRIYPGKVGPGAASRPTPRKVLLSFSDGSRFVVALPAANADELARRGGLVVELPRPMYTSCLSVMLLEADAPSAKAPRSGQYERRRDYREAVESYTAVSLTEVTPLSIVDGQPPEVAARMLVDRMATQADIGRNQRLALLAEPLAKYVMPALEERLRRDDAVVQRRLLPLLAYMPAAQAAPLLSKMFRETPPDAAAYRAIKRALVVHRRQVAPTLLQMLEEIPQEDAQRYVDVLRLYGRVAAQPELERFITQLGQGPLPVRQERVRAVAHGGPAMIAPLAAHVAAHVDEDAGRDGLIALSLIGKRMETLGEAAPDRSEPLVGALRATKQRKSGLLIVRAVRVLRPTGGGEALAEWVESAREPMLRAAAAEALASYPGERERQALERALSDASPDVRIGAARALAERADSALASEALLGYAKRERWPDGLEPAMVALLREPTPKVQAELEALILDERELARANAVVIGFMRARRPISAETARAVLWRPGDGFAARRAALVALGHGVDDAGLELLLEAVKVDALNRVETETKAAELRRVGLMALGRRRSERGRRVLLALMRDGREEEALRSAAIRALAFYSDDTLRVELEAWRPQAPVTLRKALEQTITLLSRRGDLERIERGEDEP